MNIETYKPLEGKVIKAFHYATDGGPKIDGVEIEFTDGTNLRIDSHKDAVLFVGYGTEQDYCTLN